MVKDRGFDLNSDTVLVKWDVSQAIREIISNALDEHTINKIEEDIQVSKEGDSWIIRDFGRGLRYTGLVRKEDQEKLSMSEGVIGQFGMGLKDALAILERENIDVQIESRHALMTLEKGPKEPKHIFPNIETLYVIFHDPPDSNFEGTEFRLKGVSDEDVESAKSLFFKFSGEDSIDESDYGQVIAKSESVSNIYISGLKIAEEKNFLFSYNITRINESIRKELNRERSNVGREAYRESIKRILLSCKSESATQILSEDFIRCGSGSGTESDELKWVDVQEHIAKVLNSDKSKKSIFLTVTEMKESAKLADSANLAGYQVVTITDRLRGRLRGAKDNAGNPIVTGEQFEKMKRESFSPVIVPPSDLTSEEREVYRCKEKILDLFGGSPECVESIEIAEQRSMVNISASLKGTWQPNTGRIFLSRSLLKSLNQFVATFVHELVHAKTGHGDVSRDFESDLTEQIGVFGGDALRQHSENEWDKEIADSYSAGEFDTLISRALEEEKSGKTQKI
ncbi:MAG: ATP-binding protein [Thermodesulfobacteriota bacterium]